MPEPLPLRTKVSQPLSADVPKTPTANVFNNRFPSVCGRINNRTTNNCIYEFEFLHDFCKPKTIDHLSSHIFASEIKPHERFKITLFVRTKYNLRIFEVIPFNKLKNDA